MIQIDRVSPERHDIPKRSKMEYRIEPAVRWLKGAGGSGERSSCSLSKTIFLLLSYLKSLSCAFGHNELGKSCRILNKDKRLNAISCHLISVIRNLHF